MDYLFSGMLVTKGDLTYLGYNGLGGPSLSRLV